MRYLVSFLLIALIHSAFAQTDRSKPPAPGPAPAIRISQGQTFSLSNGLTVIVVEDHRLPRIAFRLAFDWPPIWENPKGVGELTADLMQTGTTSRSKNEIDEAIDFMGASLDFFPGGLSASGMSRYAEPLLDIASDLVQHPLFPETELEKLKARYISSLVAAKANPQTMVRNVANVLTYGKEHPYGQVMTEESVGAVTLADCKNHYETYYTPGTAYLILVGDITLKQAKKWSKKYFSRWPAKELPLKTYADPQPPVSPVVAFIENPSAVQSTILLSYPIKMVQGQEDIVEAFVANVILGGGVFSNRLMMNLREDKGYTYGVRSSVIPDKYIGQFSISTQVRADVTDSALVEILREMQRMVDEPTEEAYLNQSKTVYTGEFARSLDNPMTIASFELRKAVLQLPHDYYSGYFGDTDPSFGDTDPPKDVVL